VALKARDPPTTLGRASQLANEGQKGLNERLARSPTSGNRLRDFFLKLLTDERGGVLLGKPDKPMGGKGERGRVPPSFAELEERGEYPPLTAGEALDHALILCGKFSNKDEDRKKASEAEEALKELLSEANGRIAKRFLRSVVPLIDSAVQEIGKLQTGVDARLRECEENKRRIDDFLKKFEFKLRSREWQAVMGRMLSLGLSVAALASVHAWAASHFGVLAPVVDIVLAFLGFAGGEALIKSAIIAGSALTSAYYNWKRERITNLGKHFDLNGVEGEAKKMKVLKVLASDVMEKIIEFYPGYARALAAKYGKEDVREGAAEHLGVLYERLKEMDGSYFLNLPSEGNKNT